MISFYRNRDDWRGPANLRTGTTDNDIDYVFQPVDFSMKYGRLSDMVEFQRYSQKSPKQYLVLISDRH